MACYRSRLYLVRQMCCLIYQHIKNLNFEVLLFGYLLSEVCISTKWVLVRQCC